MAKSQKKSNKESRKPKKLENPKTKTPAYLKSTEMPLNIGSAASKKAPKR